MKWTCLQLLDALLLLALRQQAAEALLEELHLRLRGLQLGAQLLPSCLGAGSRLASRLALHALQVSIPLRCCQAFLLRGLSNLHQHLAG